MEKDLCFQSKAACLFVKFASAIKSSLRKHSKMKKITLRFVLLALLIFFFCLVLPAQIDGYWKGVLKIGEQELEVGFLVKTAEDGYSATMDVPLQGVYDMPVDETTFEAGRLQFSLSAFNIVYTGILKDQVFEGEYRQNGVILPLNLLRGEKEGKKVRPQDPKEPLGYRVEEVRFVNKRDDITLAGTLTCPDGEGPFPAIVLVSGSGSQNRNEEIMNHRPFWVIADYLSRNGIVVLRYDDRGVDDSEGDPATATTLDLSYDAEAAFDYLLSHSEIDTSCVGILGHSEGGLINFMVAARRPEVAFVVSLAGPALRGIEVLKAQQRAFYKASGMTKEAVEAAMEPMERLYAVIDSCPTPQAAASVLKGVLRQAGVGEKEAALQEEVLLSPWMWYFMKYDPTDAIIAVACPALLLNGALDVQVSAVENLQAYRLLAKENCKTNLQIREMPGLNHLFQPAMTGLPEEYSRIEETISPEVLQMIADFVRVRK